MDNQTTTCPNWPKLLKGGIVVIDPETSNVRRIIPLQYNPDTISRTLQVQGAGEEAGARSQPLRLKGPPTETIKLDAEIDATDQLEPRDKYPETKENGILPQLAVLETLIYPTTAELQANNQLAQVGTLEIIPMEAPLTLFVWGKNRVVPVRITELSVTEEAFDPRLNPIRAKVSLGLRVLSVSDVGFSHPGAVKYLAYQERKEFLASLCKAGTKGQVGM